MSKKSTLVVFSILVLFIATDAKPQYYGTNGYGPMGYGQMGYGQTTTVVKQQRTPVGTTVVQEQTTSNGGYGMPYGKK